LRCDGGKQSSVDPATQCPLAKNALRSLASLAALEMALIPCNHGNAPPGMGAVPLSISPSLLSVSTRLATPRSWQFHFRRSLWRVKSDAHRSRITGWLAGWRSKVDNGGSRIGAGGGERVSVSAALPTVQGGWEKGFSRRVCQSAERHVRARGRGPNPKPNSAPPPHLFLPLDEISISHGAALPRQCRTGPHPLINLNRTALPPPHLHFVFGRQSLNPWCHGDEPAAMMKDGVHLHGACDHGDLLA
jgi:hypothetical protein